MKRTGWVAGSVLSLVLAAVAPVSAGAAGVGTVVDLGMNIAPLGPPALVNAQDEVPVENGNAYGIWVNGTVETPTPPASDVGGKFVPQAINSAGVVVGYASTTLGVLVPAYWDSLHSPSFVEISLGGLTVNGLAAASGRLVAVDATGEAVGFVGNARQSQSADTAGLFVPGAGGLPGAPQVVANLGSASVRALGNVSAGWEAGSTTAGTLFDYSRSSGATTISNLTGTESGPGGLASNGLLAGTINGGSDQEVESPSGTVTVLQTPAGTGGGVYAINANGLAVGVVRDTATTGGTWSPSGVWTPLLSELTANTPGFTSLFPEYVDDAGDIDGNGGVGAQTHGFLVRVKVIVPPVVNSTGDAAAADPSSGSCYTGQTVADATDAQVPECTLRAAIQAVNALGTSGQQVTFNIPAAVLGPIKLGSNLPPITAAGTVIDGSSETAGKVQVLGTGAATGTPTGAAGCLDVQATSVVISDLFIGACQVGIELQAPGTDSVTGDVIGLDTDGISRSANNYGVWVSNSPSDTIGGSGATDRDVISDNTRGVVIQDPGSSGDLVQGDLIGTDLTGSAFAPDTFGVTLFDAGHDTIGSPSVSLGSAGTAAGNVIVAAAGSSSTSNFSVGVLGVSNPAVDDVVAGNLIGTDVSGSQVNPAGGPGVGVALAGEVTDATISKNLIAGATADQVLLDSTEASGNKVSDNSIGATHTGKDTIPSAKANGVLIAASAKTSVAGNSVTGQAFELRIQAHAFSYPAGLTGGSTPGSSGTGKTQAVVSTNVLGPLPDGKTVPKDRQEAGVFDQEGQGDKIGPGNEVSFNRVGIGLWKTDKAQVFGNRVGRDCPSLCV
jgi:CSLREA domain-containing protein